MREGICVAGNLIVDILYPIESYPGKSELTTILDGIARSTGGAACNVTMDLASLDPDIADRTRTYLMEMKRTKRMAILYTSHNMQEMEEISDRLLFLHHGEIIARGTPGDLVARFRGEDLEDVFLKVAREVRP